MGELTIIPRDWSYPVREERSSLENPQTPLSYPAEWLLDIFNGGRTDSGIRVSELTAFQVATFLTCVDLVSGKIAALPRLVLERSFLESGRAVHRVAYEHDYYEMIAIEPNPEMNGNTFFKAFLCHCLAWGNGYCELQRDKTSNVVGLWPRNPAKTRARRLTVAETLPAEDWRPYPVPLPAGTMVYETTDAVDDEDRSEPDARSHKPRIIPMEDMVHVPGLSFDGRIGQTVVWLSRQTIGLALATEKFGAKYFANFARPGGILKMPANLGAEARNQAKNSWREAQGGENMQQVAVMPPGFEWQEITHNLEEAQAVEFRKFTRNEICSIFHVPPHMVGDVDKGRSNTEQLAQELKEYCLEPWMSAIRIEFKRKLFPSRGVGRTPKNRFYVSFDLTDLLRPDAASREKFYGGGKMYGYLCTNDIRDFEGLNPIDEPWAEQFWMPINETMVDTPIDPTHQDGAGNGQKPEPRSEPLAKGYLRLFRDGLTRILARKVRDKNAFASHLGPILFAVRDLMQSEAERRFGVEPSELRECGKFIAEYLGAMERRAPSWSPDDLERIAVRELDRAIGAIRISVFREVATIQAKQSEEVVEEEQETTS